MKRRELIQYTGLGAAAVTGGLAGCSSGDGSSGDGGSDSGGSGGGDSSSGGSGDTPSGNGGGNTTTAAAVSKTKAGMSLYPTIPHGIPLLVGQEKGIFEDNGVSIQDVVSTIGGGKGLRTLTTGGIGFGEQSPNASTKAFLQGVPIYIVAMATAIPSVDFEAQPDSDIEGIQDLADIDGRKGKIAVTRPGSSTEANAFLSVNKAEGITMDDVELVYAGGLGEAISAMQKGVADVTMNTPPLSTNLLQSGKARRVWHTRDYAPGFSEDILVMGNGVIKEQPDLARKIMTGWIAAADYVVNNVEESAGIWANAADLDSDIALRGLKDVQPEKFFDVPLREEFATNLEQVMKFQGVLSADASLDAELFDQSALPADKQVDWLK